MKMKLFLTVDEVGRATPCAPFLGCRKFVNPAWWSGAHRTARPTCFIRVHPHLSVVKKSL